MIHLRLFRLLGSRPRAIVVTATLAAIGVLLGATFVAQALLMAQVFGGIVGAWGRDPADLGARVAPWLAGLLAVLVARPTLVALRELAAARLMTRVKLTLRADLAEALVRRSAADVRGRTGADHALVVDGVENLDPYLSRYLPQQVTVLVTCLVVGAVLIAVDPLVGVVTVAAVLVLPLLPRLWDRALAARGADHWDAYGRMHAEFLDSMTGMTTLVLAGADARRQETLEGASRSLLDRTLGQLRLSLVESGLSAFALSAVPVVALAAALGRGLAPTVVFALVMLSTELVRPLRDLANHWHAGYAGTYSGRQILDVLDAASPHGCWTPGAARLDTLSRPPRACARIDGVGLTLTYPGGDAAALSEVDLRLTSGMNAVVGISGSGKSTLAAILSGLLVPQEGTVLVDGAPVSAADLLSLVATVPQDPALFAGTVADNIALGDASSDSQAHLASGDVSADDAAGDDDVSVCARLAGIGTDDPTFDLHTQAGERGGLLSGGQRQRVAIARALRQDRPVLVLDEATSALDLRSEAALVARLATHRSDRIVLVVTHRLGSLGGSDRVHVLADGRLVESGLAADLRRADGGFARLAGVTEVPA
ncbi:ATP-binding cassette domain-containing protein [Mobilicoccus massiliensis]|uniref:ATP-binding cassette domain-containing protein n=1 Tax=Mobilicoccus massiliensis TaxID=1522310 RepID=UPI00058C6280|nr:ATP-binding cassette domain-containing protein [Mobilicoccus massiliensis]